MNWISSYTHEYICKKWKPGHEPTQPPPTEIPNGHCLDDGSNRLIEFNGHCYKFYGTNPSQGVQWTESGDKCVELGNGYQLASIHSEREAAFITTMLAGQTNDNNSALWTGGYVRINNQGIYGWSDESNWNYDHWIFGEPNGMGDEVNILHSLNLYFSYTLCLLGI